jgi:dihydroorotate dehydrogenase (fumarate)
MTDLSVTIAGIHFPFCIMNASGALSTTREELLALAESQSGAIVTKSITAAPFLDPGARCGLENPGYTYYVELLPELTQSGKPVIASVAGMTADEYVTVARALAQAGASVIELNLSDPHVQEHVAPFTSAERLWTLLLAVRKEVSVPLAVKLPSAVPLSYPETAAILSEVGVEVVVCHNNPAQDGGSLMSQVTELHTASGGKLDIISVGGVSDGEDAYAALQGGARAIQIGSALVREGPSVFARLYREMMRQALRTGVQLNAPSALRTDATCRVSTE